MAAYTFQEFRDKISIIEIAESLGYFKNKVKGGQKCHTYTLGDIKNPQDEIVVYYPDEPSRQTYFSRRGGMDDKGNLISFVANRLDSFTHAGGTGFQAVNDILSRYLGDSYEHKVVAQKVAINKVNSFDIKKYNIEPAKISDFPFLLNARKLSTNTIQDFISIYAIYKVQDREKSFYNCGFPFRKPGRIEISNFELRNHNRLTNVGYKGFCVGGDKSSSSWVAAFTNKESITDVFFFESAIDAMSFYELKEITKNNTYAFVSLGGNIGRKQIENIRNEYPNAVLHFCFDNDTQGNIYDVTCAYWLQDVCCKGFKEYPTGNPVFDFNDGKEREMFDANNFNSIAYLKEKQIYIYQVHKPGHNRKDWNEELIYLSRINS